MESQSVVPRAVRLAQFACVASPGRLPAETNMTCRTPVSQLPHSQGEFLIVHCLGIGGGLSRECLAKALEHEKGAETK